MALAALLAISLAGRGLIPTATAYGVRSPLHATMVPQQALPSAPFLRTAYPRAESAMNLGVHPAAAATGTLLELREQASARRAVSIDVGGIADPASCLIEPDQVFSGDAPWPAARAAAAAV